MKRSEVKSKLLLVNDAIAKIENNDDVILYITKEKHLNGVGYIHELETIQDIIQAHTKLSKLSINASEFIDSAKALGLSEDEFTVPDTKILGFNQTHWFKDLNTRLEELKVSTKLNKLKAAKKVLEKNLSSDDQFELDTAGIDDLI